MSTDEELPTTYDDFIDDDDFDDLVHEAEDPFNTTMRIAGQHSMSAEDEARVRLHGMNSRDKQGIWRKKAIRHKNRWYSGVFGANGAEIFCSVFSEPITRKLPSPLSLMTSLKSNANSYFV